MKWEESRRSGRRADEEESKGSWKSKGCEKGEQRSWKKSRRYGRRAEEVRGEQRRWG